MAQEGNEGKKDHMKPLIALLAVSQPCISLFKWRMTRIGPNNTNIIRVIRFNSSNSCNIISVNSHNLFSFV